VDPLTQNPFGPLTFIAAPALLTNAACLLAFSTTNRMLRTREQMSHLLADARSPAVLAADSGRFVERVNRVEQQAGLMLRALSAIYIALGSFAAATLVSLLGATIAPALGPWVTQSCAAAGLVLGATGVAGLVLCCVRMMQATRLSLHNIGDEARLIRRHVAEFRDAQAGKGPDAG
jgi:hypothetical protein